MLLPEVLSFREFRAGLAATLKRVQDPETGPVFVGAHRKPEAVVMSVAHYQRLRDAAERRQAVDEALASVRLEGLEPSPEGLRMFAAVAAGTMTTDEAREQVLAPPPVSWDPYLDPSTAPRSSTPWPGSWPRSTRCIRSAASRRRW